MSGTPKPSNTAPLAPATGSGRTLAFPKSSRILKHRDFRKVYDQGRRVTSSSFVSFIFFEPLESSGGGPRFGFTTPKALGKATIRNRIRRRMREAVRLERSRFCPQVHIVFNPRRKVLDVAFDSLRQEVVRVAAQCNR